MTEKATIIKVWVVVEYEPYEGGSVEGVFLDKDKAVAFAKSKLKGQIEINDEEKDDVVLERHTIFLKSDQIFDRWKIEEWEIQ